VRIVFTSWPLCLSRNIWDQLCVMATVSGMLLNKYVKIKVRFRQIILSKGEKLNVFFVQTKSKINTSCSYFKMINHRQKQKPQITNSGRNEAQNAKEPGYSWIEPRHSILWQLPQYNALEARWWQQTTEIHLWKMRM